MYAADVQVGDFYLSGLHYIRGTVWFYHSEVIAMEPMSTRFGRPDRIVTVRITVNYDHQMDAQKKLWVSQLLQGLV